MPSDVAFKITRQSMIDRNNRFCAGSAFALVDNDLLRDPISGAAKPSRQFGKGGVDRYVT